MGLHFWLRFRGWYPHFFPLVLSAFVLVPVLGYLGFAEAGREVSALAREPGFVQRLMVETRTPSPAQRATLVRVRDGLGYSTWALLLLTLLARGVRGYLSPRRATVRVSYPDGRSVAVPAGSTVTTTYAFDGEGLLWFACHLPGHWAYGMQGTVHIR